MRSSLGFHTMTIGSYIRNDDTTKLIADFKQYSRDTGLIKIYPSDNKSDYNIIYFRKDWGIKWKIRLTEQSMKFDAYVVEATINPKILSGIEDYVTAATFDDMETAITNFNHECKKISPLLKDFYQYRLQRIDYCINFYIDELAGGCSPDLIMELIRRSDIPTHYSEYMKYDKISHRMKSPPSSFYLMNRSVNINCYSKSIDLQRRSEDRVHKGHEAIPAAILDSAHGIIRFEVQCKYSKMYTLTQEATKLGNRDYNKYKTLLSPEICIEEIASYYNKIIGKGDWYTLQAASKLIKNQHFHRQKENRLIDALQLVNQCRSLAKAKSLFQGSELDAFKRTLGDLTALRISPVTIPKDRGIQKIPNLLDAYFDKIQDEKLKKEMEEFRDKRLEEYAKEHGHFPI